MSVCRSRRIVGLVVGRGGRSVCWSVGQPKLVCQTACFFEFRSSGAPLCRSGGAFCFICKVLGSTLGCLGLLLGSSGAPFRRSGVPLASFLWSWARLWSDLGLMLNGLGVSLVPWGVFLTLERVRLAANGSRSYHFGSILDGFGMDFRDPNHSGSHIFF